MGFTLWARYLVTRLEFIFRHWIQLRVFITTVLVFIVNSQVFGRAGGQQRLAPVERGSFCDGRFSEVFFSLSSPRGLTKNLRVRVCCAKRKCERPSTR